MYDGQHLDHPAVFAVEHPIWRHNHFANRQLPRFGYDSPKRRIRANQLTPMINTTDDSLGVNR